MASTVLVKDTLWRVCVLLQDSVPQFQYWPEIELVHWLNDAQVAITKFLPAACSRVDAIKLKAGTLQTIESIAAADCKPGDGSTPAVPILGTQLVFVSNDMGANGLTPGRAITGPVDRKDLDTQSPTWHTVAAGPNIDRSYVYDPRTPRYFWVTPGVTGNVWVRAAFTAQPIPIPAGGATGSEVYLVGGGSAVKISIADEYLEDLVNYVCARAHMKDAEFSDPGKATTFATYFLNNLNSKVAALTGNNPNLKRLPLAPVPIGQAS